MGSDLVSEAFTPQDGGGASASAPFAYTNTFKEAFPYFLSIGMTYEQFWEDDVELTRYYRQAEEIRLDKINQELWLQGAYVYSAIGSMTPILRAFSKATKPEPYLEEPLPRTEKQIREIEERKFKEKEEEMKARLIGFANQMSTKKKADDEIDGS